MLKVQVAPDEMGVAIAQLEANTPYFVAVTGKSGGTASFELRASLDDFAKLCSTGLELVAEHYREHPGSGLVLPDLPTTAALNGHKPQKPKG
jgi:hypothetical protein